MAKVVEEFVRHRAAHPQVQGVAHDEAHRRARRGQRACQQRARAASLPAAGTYRKRAPRWHRTPSPRGTPAVSRKPTASPTFMLSLRPRARLYCVNRRAHVQSGASYAISHPENNHTTTGVPRAPRGRCCCMSTGVSVFPGYI